MIFAKQVKDSGGSILPLIIPSEKLMGPSIANPSILVKKSGEILVNLRNLNYFLFHSENNIHEHKWGPLVYLHPEADQTLTTYNYIAHLDSNLQIKSFHKVDTSKLDEEPKWTFIGLEDARLVEWEDRVYLCGVRRDTTTNGQGRMELSELHITQTGVSEVSRERIPVPNDQESYCEKNWMPVLNIPYHFIKWSNPTECAVYHPTLKKTTSYTRDTIIPEMPDWRGGSQVIPFGEGYLALVHETYLYYTEPQKKDATYRHRFLFWDKDFNLIKYSNNFSFLGGKIEFACGLASLGDDILITFAMQDNASYILKVSSKFIEEFLNA